MSFAPSFIASQVLGNPNTIVFQDTSQGSDTNITVRRIYLQTSNGSFLVVSGTITQYNNWLLSTNPISLNVLTKDYGLSIVVQWCDINGNILYVSNQTLGFTLYNEAFDYKLCQAMAGNPPLMNDNNWFENKSLLRTYIDSGNQAISYAADIFNAQLNYDAATKLRLNSKYIFNINC